MLAKITPDGNRIEVSQMSKSDLGHIETISRAKRWSWQAKKYIEVSYLYMFTFLPSGFYKRLLGLNKDGLVQNLTLKGMEYITNNIIQEDLEEWVMDEDYMFSPKWYQSKALYLSLRFNRMRIEIATGGGKSFIIAMYVRYLLQNELKPGDKIVICTIRRMLVDQMIDDIYSYNKNKNGVCSFQAVYAGSEENENANVIVGTYQSMSNWPKERFAGVKAFVCDEVHMGCVASIKDEIIPKLPNDCKRFVGFSGTMPEHNTIEDLHLEAYFGPIGMQVSAKQLQDEGSIAKIHISIINIIYGLKTSKAYFYDENVLKGGPSKLKGEREILQTLNVRNDFIRTVCGKFVGNQVILVDSVDYAKFLVKYLGELPNKQVRLIYGGTKTSTRNEIKSEMKMDGDDIILVATYETMSTGVSINNIMAIHFPDGGKSRIRIRQSCGRGLRLHPKKDYLQVFDYVDNFTKYYGEKVKDDEGNVTYPDAWPGPHKNIFQKHGKERIKIYEKERFPIKYVEFKVD